MEGLGVEEMSVVYPNMEAKIAMRGIRKKKIATTLGISERCLYNKLKGEAFFTYPEVEILQSVFFPDMTKEELMKRSEEESETEKDTA